MLKCNVSCASGEDPTALGFQKGPQQWDPAPSLSRGGALCLHSELPRSSWNQSNAAEVVGVTPVLGLDFRCSRLLYPLFEASLITLRTGGHKEELSLYYGEPQP